MKISIITISYNSAATIEDTIKSVLGQTHQDIEYIIVDGASKDATLNIIKKYQTKIAKVVSESDKGIYDAMNKGISMATGEVVGILNSDDFYSNNEVLAKVAAAFSSPDITACYGDIIYIDRTNKEKIVRYWRAGVYRKYKLFSGWAPPHPAFFVRRSVYQQYGVFNCIFKIAADYELMLRFIKKAHLVMRYIPEQLVCMREGGYSAASISRRIAGWRELYQAWRVNKLVPPPWLIITRPLSKVSQYFLVRK